MMSEQLDFLASGGTRRKGRDPVKRKASKKAYEERNRGRAIAGLSSQEYKKQWRKKNAEKLKAQRQAKRKTEAYKALRRAQCERARRRKGMKLMLASHSAHVTTWKKWRAAHRLHDAHVKAFFADDTRAYRWRYRHDEEFRLAECLRRQLQKKAQIERIATALRGALRGKRRAKAVEQLLGYSMAQLKQHLERQFTHGMTWDNYGKNGWHIDHVLPKRFFELNKEDEVIKFWSLPNLRPLRASDNIRKHQKRTHLL